jgi:predicted lysophospholipase L1 biosynthesis ABC-type transport system permease subunit
VVVASERWPLPAVTLAEVLATSDVPGGAINILTGRTLELVPWLAGHMDVNAIDVTGVPEEARAQAEELAAANVKRVTRARIADLPGDLGPPQRGILPLEVKRLDQLNDLPWILGGVLALIGVLGVGYALVTAVRRRDRDLAVLKTLGFRRRQIIETVAMQATVFALIGLVIGIPLGLVVGRSVWQQVADGAGLAADVTLPALLIAGVAVATLLVVNIIAVIPARTAARTRPATVLRSE